MLKTEEEIKLWLDSMEIKGYTINKDLTVDVSGNVNLSSQKITSLPVQFGKITGNFYCNNNNKLTSLKGSPIHVGG